MTAPILTIDNVSKRFIKAPDLAGRVANIFGADNRTEVIRAVDHVTLSVSEGEVLGLVGESGCGKSTLGRMIAGLMKPSEGEILYRGGPVEKSARYRSTSVQVQMIFQDPMSSLNPRLRVDQIVGEAPLSHGKVPRAQFDDFVAEALKRVGLDPAYASRYPHQFSGGQRQRIGIARALAINPEILVCDESVAALDVSIQAQIINLFMDLRRDLGLTYLFISHDLGVVQHLSDRVAIMYLGRVVELAPTEELFTKPNHPYTQALLSSLPHLSERGRSFHPIRGEIPSPLAPPPGCHFHPRCQYATDRCRVEAPRLVEIAPHRFSACHLNEES
jgi:peptide/nickel transport system ATP-binding protein